MFRNLIVYRLSPVPMLNAAALSLHLKGHAFLPCGELQMQSVGWISPVDGGDLAHGIPDGHIFIALCTEKKSMPAQVIERKLRERTKAKAAEQGFACGRVQTRELRELVIDELLPQAFATRNTTAVWLDTAGGWLGVDTASFSRAEDVYRMLLRSLDQLPISTLQTKKSPVAVMTAWVSHDDLDLPFSFDIDDEAELRGIGIDKPTIKYARHSLDGVASHIAAGKKCVQLAMTWGERISFVLTEGFVLKRITPLGTLKVRDDRDAELFLMAGEFRALLGDLVEALGGEVEE